jgi:hypothetical protein
MRHVEETSADREKPHLYAMTGNARLRADVRRPDERDTGGKAGRNGGNLRGRHGGRRLTDAPERTSQNEDSDEERAWRLRSPC